jgi:hypothetical protein
MSEPTNITNNAATIYGADLLYEQNCKCGTIEVLSGGETWTAGDGDNVWRMDILFSGDISNRPALIFQTLVAKNISASDCTKLIAARYLSGQTIMGDFTSVSTNAAVGITVILYKDCKQS